MDRPSRSRVGSEAGQILAVFAMSLVAMVLVVGLVIDGGVAFIGRRDAQNAADTGALAGTRIVTLNYVDAARSSADVYIAIAANVETANGCLRTAPVPCSWTAQYVDRYQNPLGPVVNLARPLPPGAQGVQVVIARQPPTYFLGVIGQTSWSVGADAIALTVSVTSAPPGQLLPVGTNLPQPFEVGAIYTLTSVNASPQGQSPDFGPGNFGWLQWVGGPNKNPTLENSICSPDNPSFTLPHEVPGHPGGQNSGQNGVRGCLDYWISSGATVLIPMVSGCSPCNGDKAVYTIEGIAAFVLTGYGEKGPAVNTLQGRFVEYYALPGSNALVGAGTGGPPSAGDTTYFLGLVK